MRTKIIERYHKTIEEHITETQALLLDNMAGIDCLTTGDLVPTQLDINDNYDIKIEENLIDMDQDDSVSSNCTEHLISDEHFKQLERQFMCNDVDFEQCTSIFLNGDGIINMIYMY